MYMATYKVLQDIEAEDKLIGPLTFKQLIFALIAAALIFMGWFIGSNSTFWIIVPFVVLAAPFIFLAAPIGKDQPNDVWLGARLRFLLKPRTRKWNQTGQSDHVTVTAPKVEEHVYTDGLNNEEVNSRLKLLANTLDSRGWAVKNANVNLEKVTATSASSDGARLVAPGDLPQQVQKFDVKASDDMFDPTASAVGQNVDQLIAQHEVDNKRIAVDAMHRAAQPQRATHQEEEFLEQLHKQQDRLGIHHDGPEMATADTGGISPSAPAVGPTETNKEPQSVNTEPGVAPPDIIKEFSETNDLKVSTLASLAKNKVQNDTLTDDTVIELH